MWPGFDSGLFSCSKRLLPGYSRFLLSQKPKFELICCVLVKQLCLTEYIETYYHYWYHKISSQLFQFTTVSSILFRTQVPFPLRHVLLASSTIFVKSSWDKFSIIYHPWHYCSLSLPPIMHWSCTQALMEAGWRNSASVGAGDKDNMNLV